MESVIDFDNKGLSCSRDYGFDHSSQLETSPLYRKLINFLRPYKIIKGESKTPSSKESNIFSPHVGSWHVPDSRIPEYFDLLERCRKAKLDLRFAEKQEEPSGLMFDFDILQEDSKCRLVDRHFHNTVKIILEKLAMMMDITPENAIFTHVLVSKKPTPIWKEESNAYKDGMHIVIPGIKLGRQVKKYFIKYLQSQRIIEDIFGNIKLVNSHSDVLDVCSSTVPVFFTGNKSKDKPAYEIKYIFKAEVTRTQGAFLSELTSEDMNVSYAFSINHERKGGLVKKRQYFFNSKYQTEFSMYKTSIVEIKKTEDDMNLLSLHDPDTVLLRNLIDIMKPERFDTQGNWWKLVQALANISFRNKELARYASQKSTKYVDGVFEKQWDQSISKRYGSNLSEGLLYGWAKQDNPSAFKIVLRENIYNWALDKYITDGKTMGDLQHYDVAELLHKLLKDKFVTDIDKTTQKRVWYEFVSDEEEGHEKGELYKWRECIAGSSTLENYMSKKIPVFLDKILSLLSKKREDKESKDTCTPGDLKYFDRLISNLRNIRLKVRNHGFKQAVLKEAQAVFYVSGFINSLDKDPNILGVGNGVLVLEDDGPRLITGYHRHRISRFTEVEFHPIDPTDELTQSTFKSIWELYPEEEKKEFEFIMSYFSLSVGGHQKPCALMTLRGGGANGKSYLTESVNNMLGDATNRGYGCKLPCSYLVEKEDKANQANPTLMCLEYARAAYFSEADKNEIMKVSKVKRITSHEALSARGLFKGQKNFRHNAILIFQTNFALSIFTTDHGTWRRMWFYNQKMKFCSNPDPENPYERKKDKSFSSSKSTNLESLSALLGIMVMFFYRVRLMYDDDVENIDRPIMLKETAEFRNEQDIMNKFISHRIVSVPDKKHLMPMRKVIDFYEQWYDTYKETIRHDRQNISLSLRNSAIGKHFELNDLGEYSLKGHRVLGTGERKTPDESYVVPLGRKKKLSSAEGKELTRTDGKELTRTDGKELTRTDGKELTRTIRRDTHMEALNRFYSEYKKITS